MPITSMTGGVVFDLPPPLLSEHLRIGQLGTFSCQHVPLSIEEEVLSLQHSSEPPSVEKLLSILQQCRRHKKASCAKHVQIHVHEQGLETLDAIGNYLVPLFAECGSVSESRQVFQRLVSRNEHSWTSLIRGCVVCGEFERALQLFRQMQDDSICPSSFTFAALLKACSRLKCADVGHEIHTEMVKAGFDREVFIGNSLIDMYAKSGLLLEAQEVLKQLPNRGVVSWSALIGGYVEHLRCEEALECLKQMQADGVPPNVVTYVSCLKACGSIGAIEMGQELHNGIAKEEFEKEPYIVSTLIDMYTKCGLVAEAWDVFDTVQVRDGVLWNSIIAGYVEQGHSNEALRCFEQMQREGVPPTAVTYVFCLKACGNTGAIDKGRELVAKITKEGLKDDLHISSCLVDMYAKCGSLVEAQEALDNLPVRDIVVWNALIIGYADKGYAVEVLVCMDKMQHEGVSANSVTFVSCLKACSSIRDLGKGHDIHNDIVAQGYEGFPYVGNILIDMYSKCGSFNEAWKVLNDIPAQDAVPWNALLAGCAEHGFAEKALNCLGLMELAGVFPNLITFACSLKVCAGIGAISKVLEIHTRVIERGLETDSFISGTLIDTYVKCNSLADARGVLERMLVRDVISCTSLMTGYVKSGSLAEALEIFDELSARDVVAWNTVIAGYAELGLVEEVLSCLEKMQLDGICPNAVSFACSLKVCASTGDIQGGRKIHSLIAVEEFEADPFVGSALVVLYAKCGSLEESLQVLDTVTVRDVVLWNALITGYAEHGLGKEALSSLEQMQLEGLHPNFLTFVGSLQACTGLGAIERGRNLHADIVNLGFERECFIECALLNMYAKCGSLIEAQDIFDEMVDPDRASWTALIAGYVECGFGEEALDLFKQMQSDGIYPEIITFICSLQACASAGALQNLREIHTDVVMLGFNDDLLIGNTLIDVYGKCGLLAEAQDLLNKLSGRNVVSWNALITAFGEHGFDEEAFKCMEQMRMEMKCPDPVSLLCSLKACTGIGAIDMGREIHVEIVKEGLDKDFSIENTLVDMYAKCGSLAEAQKIFDEQLLRDPVSWNALIAGYARKGEGEQACHLFERMRKEGVSPNDRTFLSIFSACNHIGLVDKGKEYFEVMITEYSIIPSTEHQNCLIDLCGRAGQLEEALTMLVNLLPQSTCVAWTTMLGACRKWGNLELGKQAFEYAVSLDKTNDAAYVLMHNIYADAQMWDEMKMVEVMMMNKHAQHLVADLR